MNPSAVSNRSAGAAQAAIPLRKRVAKVAVSVAAVAALTAAPAVAFDAELGEEVFDANCATCHSGGGNVLIPYKTLKKDAIEKYLEGGFNVTSILYQVNNGKAQMPAWKNVLEPEEIDAVANYVFATASADGW